MATGLESASGLFSFGNFASGASMLALLLIIVFGVFVLATLAFFGYRSFNSRTLYKTQVHIYYQEPGTKSPIYYTDKGGVFTNKKTNMKRFYLQNQRVGLNPDNIPFIFGKKGQKIVTLWQTGIKSFRYVNPTVSDNPGLKFNVGEEDVNWALVAFNEWVNRFKVSSFLQQYGHMILWAVTVMGTLFLLFFVMEKFDVLASVANSLNEAAQAMKQASVGTIVE